MAANAREAHEAAVKIAQAMRNEYIIGYRPASNGGAGKWPGIQVKSKMPGTRTYADSAYYSQ